ncbi:MAG: hypothetical protein ABI877_23455, partial [Gemmatimonadaceae bacterium]
MKRLFPIAIAASLATLPLMQAQAQAGLTFWAGYAQSADSGSANMSNKGAQLGAQLGLPLVPIALRADALHWGTKYDSDHISLLGSGVIQLRLPLLQVYGLAGWGKFAVTDSSTANGWQAGGGIRLG